MSWYLLIRPWLIKVVAEADAMVVAGGKVVAEAKVANGKTIEIQIV